MDEKACRNNRMGVVHSLGIGLDSFWDSIRKGRNGISHITKFDVSDLDAKVASEVRDFEPTDFVDKKKPKGWIHSHNMRWLLPK